MKDKIVLQIILLVVLNISLKGQNNTARNYGYLKKNTETKEIKESELEYVDSLNIFFETDKCEISIIEKNKIHNFLGKVDTLHLKSITVNAFCDDRGSVNYNEKLSIKRANYIENFLKEINIKKTLTYNTSGKGILQLNNSESKSTSQQRSFNRRAVIYFYYENPKKKITKKNILSLEETTDNNSEVKQDDSTCLFLLYGTWKMVTYIDDGKNLYEDYEEFIWNLYSDSTWSSYTLKKGSNQNKYVDLKGTYFLNTDCTELIMTTTHINMNYGNGWAEIVPAIGQFTHSVLVTDSTLSGRLINSTYPKTSTLEFFSYVKVP
jgi:outer membrane protein OmpA-like peptidoglycan-associated protein